MDVNATAPRQNARSLRQRRRVFVVGRRVIVRPSPYRLHIHLCHLHRQPPLFNPQGTNQVSTGSLPRPPMPPRPNLPLSLCRPKPHEVDVEDFNRMWPQFGGAPPGFVRDALPFPKGGQMLHNVRNTKIVGHSNPGEPQECEVQFDGPVYNDYDVPSHVLAVNQGRDVKFFPVHRIIFAVNCATLPYFPYSPSSRDNPSGRFTLPVVKLEVPSLESFHVLFEHLYTKDVVRLRRILTPPPEARSLANLYRQIGFIHGLWKNACTLCVVDLEFYVVIQDLYTGGQNDISRIKMESSTEFLQP